MPASVGITILHFSRHATISFFFFSIDVVLSWFSSVLMMKEGKI
jgi:hypothetical protein